MTKKIKAFKKGSYFFLTLFSTVLTLAISAEEDEVPTKNSRQPYCKVHNDTAEKYSKKYPDIVKNRSLHKQEPENSNVNSDAKEFRVKVKALKGIKEEEDRNEQKVLETIIEGTSYVAKTVVDKKIEDPEEKNKFFGIIDSIKEGSSNFFTSCLRRG